MQENLEKEAFNEFNTQEEGKNIEYVSKEKTLVGKFGSFMLELIKIALLAGLTIFFVRYYLFKPFSVRGASMEPNYYEKDYLIIDEISYRFREPKRGETVVIESPNDKDTHYLKRIIGLPNEKVKIEDNKVIVFNDEYPQGVILDETDYLAEETPGTNYRFLGEDEYYVLGDNRDASLDSRKFGPVQKSSIVGRAWFRGLPVSRIGFIGESADNNDLH